jgi:serine/threonine protein kinase/Flp pilus assembly protein TadD
LVGKTILHYRIIKKLGEGGMGIVYLAEDKKLERQVAIKFLPHHVAASSDERKRFEIEAKAAAALNHPNIATIHAIEETEDNLFLVMEYIPGKHLKEHINSKPLTVKEALNIALQIAKGLQAAHKKSIIHRDIKSANIMSREDGQIRIMDFGLAKFRESGQITREGTTVGTAAYMSPEQARGEETDQRTDIWSFGVVLYEMLTGHPPFKGEYEQALIFNLLNEQIIPASELNPEAPDKLNAIINKCLEKDKNLRFGSMDEILVELTEESDSQASSSAPVIQKQVNKSSLRQKRTFKRWPLLAVGVVVVMLVIWFLSLPKTDNIVSSKKMLVVLPFENLGAAENDYFADGITGEITSKLSGLSGLGIIARSSAMQYKNSSKSLQEIGEELGVQYILEGTIQWEQKADGKKRIRVNPELIKIENATQIWSQPYEADFSSIFDLQANIASKVAMALDLTLVRSEKQILENRMTENSEAYDLYLRAKVYGRDVSNEKNIRIARQMFLKALELDSNFADAYAGLSIIQSTLYWEYYDRTEDNLKQSEFNARKAISLNQDLANGYVALGSYHYHGRLDYESALSAYNRALEIQQNNVEAINGIGFVLRRQGKMRKAITYLEKSSELDPKNYIPVYSVGETYGLIREYEKALSHLDKALLLSPDASVIIDVIANIYALRDGDIQKARNIILSAQRNKIGQNYSPFLYSLFQFDLYERKYDQALKQIEEINPLNEQFYYLPKELLAGIVNRFLNNETKAKNNFESAKKILLQKIKENPQDSRLYTSLGIACAGLGQKEEAIRDGKKGVELLPVERESWRGSFRLFDLAQIYALTGEAPSALNVIDKLLQYPTDVISVSLLKLYPLWDTLRTSAEYKRIIGKYAEGQ